MKIENFLFRTDLPKRVVKDWPVTQWMMILSKISLNKKLMLSSQRWLIYFSHCFSFAALLTVNFVCNQCKFMPEILFQA